MAPFTTGIRQPHTGDGLVYINGTWVPANLGQGIPAAQPPSYTGLPLSPKHDDEWVYQLATGTYWRFKYDLYSAYWNFLGGGSSIAIVASPAFTSSATAAFQSSGTPNVTAPFAGDYEIFVFAMCNQATSNMWPGRVQPVASPALTFANYGESTVVTAAASAPIDCLTAITGVTAGTVFAVGCYTNDGTPAHTTWTQRVIKLTPIRVH